MNNLNKHQYINKLSDKSKKTFITRFISSFYIVGYLLLSLFLFLVVDSHKEYTWIPMSFTVKQVMIWILLVYIFPVIYLATKEIRDLHFLNNKVAFNIILVSLIINIYTPTLIYLLPFYHFVFLSKDNIIFWFLISIIICMVVTLIINFIYFYFEGVLTIKYFTTHYLMIFLVSGFFLSFLFFGIVKSWTTILILYLITALTDTFAYLTGMLFGRRKISPYISPNKTIGGLIGGIVLATLLTMLVIFIFSFIPDNFNVLGNFFGVKFKYSTDFINVNNAYTNFPLWWLSIFFILIALSFSSFLGDLSFSFIKRKYGVKDFSNLIQGHGGILDRIDSLTFVFSIYFIVIVFVSLFSTTSPLI